MERVKRTTEDMKTRKMISREEAILKRMREAKGVDDSLIDLTLSIPKAKPTGSDQVVDARYEEIEKMFLDEFREPSADYSDAETTAAIEGKAKKAKVEETRRMKECYLNPDYMAASQKARDSRRKMIELLEAQGIEIDESVEL